LWRRFEQPLHSCGKRCPQKSRPQELNRHQFRSFLHNYYVLSITKSYLQWTDLTKRVRLIDSTCALKKMGEGGWTYILVSCDPCEAHYYAENLQNWWRFIIIRAGCESRSSLKSHDRDATSFRFALSQYGVRHWISARRLLTARKLFASDVAWWIQFSRLTGTSISHARQATIESSPLSNISCMRPN